MTDAASPQKNPPGRPVRLGRLRTASDVRRACKRVGDAVLAGHVEPRRANSALYAVSGAAKAIELEIAERLERRLADLRDGEQRPSAHVLEHVESAAAHMPVLGRVIEGETEKVA